MKNINIKSALFVFFLLLGASCTKRVHPSEEGFVKLTLNEPEVTIYTKGEVTSGTLPVVDDTYSVVITSEDGTVVKNVTYSSLKGGFTLAPGNYSIYAQNITEEEALTLREGRGEQRFYGESEFTVQAGKTTEVSFICEMVNARVSIGFDDTFVKVFKEAQVIIYKKSEEGSDDKRSFNDFVYNSTQRPTIDDEAKWTYFNMDENHSSNPTTLKMSIIVKRNDDLVNTYAAEVTLAPKTWHRLNIKSETIDGNLELGLYSNDEFNELDEVIGVNPF